jgi:hypothetical protein
MKKLHFILNLIVLSFIGLKTYCQSTEIGKLEVSLSGGFSFPICDYQNHDPSDAAILDKKVSFTQIIGISKEKNGFASIGYNYNILIKYKVTPSLRIVFSTTRIVNPVTTKGISEYITSIYDRAQTMKESDYKILFLMPGIGYEHSFKKIILGFNLLIGYSFAEYPYYEFIQNFMMLNHPPIFAHEGSRPTLHSFTYGASGTWAVRLSKRMKIGIEANFLSSKFSYNMMNTLIPGGSAPYNISDKLNVKVINITPTLSYSFF